MESGGEGSVRGGQGGQRRRSAHLIGLRGRRRRRRHTVRWHGEPIIERVPHLTKQTHTHTHTHTSVHVRKCALGCMLPAAA